MAGCGEGGDDVAPHEAGERAAVSSTTAVHCLRRGRRPGLADVGELFGEGEGVEVHHGLRARTKADQNPSWTGWLSVISTSTNPHFGQPAVSGRGDRPGDTRRPRLGVGPERFVGLDIGHHIGHRQPAARSQDPVGFGEHRGLLGGQVDDAVRHHHVDTGVGERDVFNAPFEELGVRDPSLGLVGSSQLQHLVVMSTP